MRNLGWQKLLRLALASVLFAACSADSSEAVAESEAVAQSTEEWCATGADQIIDRLELFLADLPDIPAEEFLALEEVDGLPAFQNDVADIISRTTSQSSTLCNLDGLQDLVGPRLADVERDGVLAEFLIATIRDGRELTVADLAVATGDDVEAVLSLLDDGSTLTFAPGVYALERPLLVGRSITFLGESVQSTTLRSTSEDAAIVVVGRGELIMRDLRVEHQGDAAASVILAFDRPVDLRDVHLGGGVSDADGGAGNGLVLSDEAFGGAPSDGAEKPRSVVISSVLAGNDGAGIAVSGALNPRLERLEIVENGICGVCFFGAATGEVLDSAILSNDFGIQIGDDGSPRVTGNMISTNATAGMVILGTAAPVIDGNVFDTNTEVAIALQESAAPTITNNSFVANPFGLSVASNAAVVIRDNTIDGGDIGIQMDEQASPLVENNRISGTQLVGIALTGQATGSYRNNMISISDGVGVVSDIEAAPEIDGLDVQGGAVAVAYAAASSGTLSNATFTGQDIGIQIDDETSPQIDKIEIADAVSAGIVIRGTASAQLSDVQILRAGEVGFALADMTAVTLDRVEVVGAITGGSIVGASTAIVRDSRFEDLEIGIQVGEQARPTLQENEIVGATSAAVVFVGESGGTAERNRIREPGIVGIQLGENAQPLLTANVIFASQPPEPPDVSTEASEDGDAQPQPELTQEPESNVADDFEDGVVDDSATVGILYAGEAAGTASDNQIIGFVIGIQASESSSPDVTENAIDGGVLLGVGVLFRDEASGTVQGNETSSHSVGIQVGDTASPTIDSNTVVTASNVAILVQGSATPVLTNNVCPTGLAGIGLLDGTDPERRDNECVEVLGQ